MGKAKARHPHLYKKFLRYKRSFTPQIDRKTRHYDLVKGIVEIPLLVVYERIQEVTWDDLPQRFVIKADIGTGTNVVKCLEKIDDDVYLDMLRRRRPAMSGQQLIDFFADKGRILIERFLHDPVQGEIPFDVKMYVAYDELLFVRIVRRKTPNSNVSVAILDRNFKRVPHLAYFTAENHIDAEPEPLPFSRNILQRGRSVATAIGKRLKTPFISVDLYAIKNEKIYLGELTWAPGPLVFEPMQPEIVQFLYDKISEKEILLRDVQGALVQSG